MEITYILDKAYKLILVEDLSILGLINIIEVKHGVKVAKLQSMDWLISVVDTDFEENGRIFKAERGKTNVRPANLSIVHPALPFDQYPTIKTLAANVFSVYVKPQKFSFSQFQQ